MFFRFSVCITDRITKINEDREWNFGATAVVSNGQYGCKTKYGYFRFSHEMQEFDIEEDNLKDQLNRKRKVKFFLFCF